jgi:hypothetical protein
MCATLIQMVWYRPWLLRKLYLELSVGNFFYCEAFAASLCRRTPGCEIDAFVSRRSESDGGPLFGRWTYHRLTHHKSSERAQLPSNNSKSQLYHPVKNPYAQSEQQLNGERAVFAWNSPMRPNLRRICQKWHGRAHHTSSERAQLPLDHSMSQRSTP